MPDEKAATLTPDTLLTDPRTGRQTALSQMSTRSLDRALDALEGKTVPQNPKPVSVGVALAGVTREDAAAAAQRIMGLLADQLADISLRITNEWLFELEGRPPCRPSLGRRTGQSPSLQGEE